MKKTKTAKVVSIQLAPVFKKYGENGCDMYAKVKGSNGNYYPVRAWVYGERINLSINPELLEQFVAQYPKRVKEITLK